MPRFLDQLQIDGISIPIAILIWIMIYPMMMKVDFQSIREVGRHPKGLFVTWITNWLIKPFTMYGLAAFFFYHGFHGLIPEELATQYMAGGRSPGCSSLYGHGLCMEHPDQGGPPGGLYSRGFR